MKFKRLLPALGLVLVFLCAWFFMRSSGRNGSGYGKEGRLFPSFSVREAARIEISENAVKKAVIVKKGSSWAVENLGGFPADGDKVMEALFAADKLNDKMLISKNRSKQSLFGLEDTGVLVEIFSARGSAASAPMAAFYAGKRGPDYGSSYTRKKNDYSVYLVKGLLQDVISADTFPWLRKKVFASGRPEEISVNSGDQKFLMKHEGDTWYRMPDRLPLSADSANGLLAALTEIGITDYFYSPSGGKYFNRVEMEALVKAGDGNRERLIVGDTSGDSQCFAWYFSPEHVAVISRARIDDIKKRAAELNKK